MKSKDPEDVDVTVQREGVLTSAFVSTCTSDDASNGSHMLVRTPFTSIVTAFSIGSFGSALEFLSG